MFNKEQVKTEAIRNIQWSNGGITPDNRGGQSCGMINPEVTLYSEDFGIKITVCSHKSKFKNKELALTLFELAMDDLIK